MKYSLLCLSLFITICTLSATEGSGDLNFFSTGRVVKSFGEYNGDAYFTGIAVEGPESKSAQTAQMVSNEIPAAENSRVIFYAKNRKRSLHYPSGNLMVLENENNDMRYYYHHLADRTADINDNVTRNEIVGFAGNSGRTEDIRLVFEIEDIKNKRYVNPLQYYPVLDTLAPRLMDLYFVDKTNQTVSLNSEYKLVRGGKLFLLCKDSITTRRYYIEPIDYVAPYRISVYIDGRQTNSITFDYIYKKENRLTLGDTNMTFTDLYANNVDSNYFILDYTALPGLISIKVIVEDINGNEKRFIKAIRVLPPEL